MIRTDNPIADAEAWASRKDPRPLVGYCCICGAELRGTAPGWDADDGYFIEGDVVCDDCLREYMKGRRIANVNAF